MSEEAKTYVFGNSDSQFAPLMAAMNNGGFGGNLWWVILFLIAFTTVSIIGLTTSPMLFLNTIDHEKGHIASHIGKLFNLDPYGELILYLLGLIGLRMYPSASKFLCPHCKKELQLDLFSQYDIK